MRSKSLRLRFGVSVAVVVALRLFTLPVAYGVERDVVKNTAVSIIAEVANNPKIGKTAWDWGEGILFWGVANVALKDPTAKARALPLLRDYFSNAILNVEDPIHVTPAIAALQARALFADDTKTLGAISSDLETSMDYVKTTKRNAVGSIDHYGNSWINTWNLPHRRTIWLDSTIAWQVAAARYAVDRSDPQFADFVFSQPGIFSDLLKDEKYGLYYHAAKVNSKRTLPGRPNFWLRGNGWLAATLVEMLESLQVLSLDTTRTKFEAPIQKQLQDLIDALVRHQRDSGLWTTIVNDPKSYAEVSGSALLVYAIKKGIRIGVLDRKYEVYVDKGLDGIMKKLKVDDFGTSVPQISAGTFPVPFLSKYYYRHIPLMTNKNYGIGAVLLAMSEYL